MACEDTFIFTLPNDRSQFTGRISKGIISFNAQDAYHQISQHSFNKLLLRHDTIRVDYVERILSCFVQTLMCV